MEGATSRARSRAARPAAVTAAVLAGAALLAACGSSGTTAVASTAPVERATISVGVSGAGTMAASSSRNLGFAAGGLLTSVDVQVGDTVTAGQVLARIDRFQLEQLVVQQKANLSSQKAALAKLENSPALQGTRNTLAQARTIRNATSSQVAATKRADRVALSRANGALNSAQAALAACTTDCASLQAAVVSAQTAVSTAEQTLKVATAAGKVSVASAEQGVVTAQNAANSAASDRPYTIAQQKAAVTTAQSLVDVAKHNLSLATLKAPFDGTVTAINGAVGEYLTASTGTSAEAPGTDAAVPGTTVVAGTSTTTRAGGTQFMVISATGPMTAVVPFQELDAAGIVAGQTTTLTFDALPDVTTTGEVTAISPAGTALGGSMSYLVTVSLDTSDKRLKEGMTVHATVATEEKKDVLSVPNDAVRTENGQSVVTLVDAAGAQRTVDITAGLVGPDRTEVVSGLAEGDQVLLPTSTTH
ncbi:MAG: biotin/lipoyl-binding protein [Propionicimonas sp.]|uniref:efflux RND transporter periplasmic adaptor subunit n=1 Tax=Propionicimonas sp. TaxID=1955623 RepID=UPI003D107FC9